MLLVLQKWDWWLTCKAVSLDRWRYHFRMTYVPLTWNKDWDAIIANSRWAQMCLTSTITACHYVAFLLQSHLQDIPNALHRENSQPYTARNSLNVLSTMKVLPCPTSFPTYHQSSMFGTWLSVSSVVIPLHKIKRNCGVVNNTTSKNLDTMHQRVAFSDKTHPCFRSGTDDRHVRVTTW